MRRALAQDEQLRKVPVSIDTFQAEVARQAVQAGASIVNDISGGGMDPDMHAQVRNKIAHTSAGPSIVNSSSSGGGSTDPVHALPRCTSSMGQG